ncbi:MAG TPA: CaiB/BaiF CoA-transferase family protein [Stellaceae bacterium]|nr:CaiB/BaiF CoA-transferase family protein [Stellaceae bacterium]
MSLPLSRFTVLDLTHARAGPTAVRQLADWGANVIKIEPPSGDDRDVTGTRRDGFDFQNLHRNKRSLALNLKTPEGKAVFFKLAEKADVIVENFRSEVKYRLGVDYESVKKLNPRIVYGSISGFGQSGPYAKRPGVDQIAQGMGGLMSITGLPGQGPVRVGIPIDDLCAGILLAQAILMALIEREQSGEGQWVHTSLLEAQIFMLDFQASRWLQAHEVPKQAGNDHPTGIPTGLFPTADGQINIAASGDHMFRRFCEAADAQFLLNDPDYASQAQRSKNRKPLNEKIAEITKKRPSNYWVELLNEVGVPCGPLYTIDQTFADPQVKHLEMARSMDHPRLGELKVVGQAINLTKTPEPARMRHATPDLGEHSEEILRDLGYDAAAIADLHARNVI